MRLYNFGIESADFGVKNQLLNIVHKKNEAITEKCLIH
jgi:hypothetical protein